MKLKKLVLSGSMAVVFALGAGTATYAKCGSSEIASYKVEKGTNLDHAINQSLTGKPGDPVKGLATMVHRKKGNCLGCHKISAILKLAKPDDLESLKKYSLHGEVGPSLDGLASRYTEGEMRMLVVDPKKIYPDTLMPSFHKAKGHFRPKKGCEDKAPLSASEVEDVVAYLKTLK